MDRDIFSFMWNFEKYFDMFEVALILCSVNSYSNLCFYF